MTAAVKKSILLLFLLLSLTAVRGQPDSLSVDSIAARIKVILEEYNDKTLYVDTSDYIQNVYTGNDWNLQIASSLGACNEIIRLFVRGADVNSRAGGTAAPIHYAISSGRWEAVEILLLLGADPEKKDLWGNTPLVVAVRANSLVIAEKLIRYGANPDNGDKQNSTPMHHSAALGNFDITDMLLYYNALTEIFDSEGNTPLMNGVCFGYHDIVDLLLQSGADPNAADKKGFTPLMAASQNGDTLMMRLLTDAGANLYAVNNEGLDALGCAVASLMKESVAYLIGRGTRWDQTAGTKANPVTIATTSGSREILQMLLDSGLKAKKTHSFDVLSFSPGGLFTNHCGMAGGTVSLFNPALRTGITLGAAANPVSQRMLVKGNNDIIYQYHVKSTLIHAGLFREYRISKPYNDARWMIVPSLSAGYRFHSLYQGTSERPENSVVIMPAADLKVSIRSVGASAGIMYMKLPFYKAGPVWLTVRAYYSLTRTSGSFSFKKVRLYNYEQN
jgi:ankyrin repeat protein